jgi:hypothetical protein
MGGVRELKSLGNYNMEFGKLATVDLSIVILIT